MNENPIDKRIESTHCNYTYTHTVAVFIKSTLGVTIQQTHIRIHLQKAKTNQTETEKVTIVLLSLRFLPRRYVPVNGSVTMCHVCLRLKNR